MLCLIRLKPGRSSAYYNGEYARIFKLTGHAKVYNTGASKWFARLRKEGYITSEYHGNEMWHYPTSKEWVDDRTFIDDSDGWDLVDKDGTLHRRNNNE